MSIQWDRPRVAELVAGAVNARAMDVHAAAVRRADGRFPVGMRAMGDSDSGAMVYSDDPAAIVAEFGDGATTPDGWGWGALTDVAEGVADG